MALNQRGKPSLAKAALSLYRAAKACAMCGSLGLRQDADF